MLLVILLVVPGLYLFRRFLLNRLTNANLPILAVARYAPQAATGIVLFLFVLIAGYASNVAPDAWDFPLGILSLAFVGLPVVWVWRWFEARKTNTPSR